MLDMSKDTLHVGVADVTLRLNLSPGDRYEAPLDGSSEIKQRQGFQQGRVVTLRPSSLVQAREASQ